MNRLPSRSRDRRLWKAEAGVEPFDLRCCQPETPGNFHDAAQIKGLLFLWRLPLEIAISEIVIGKRMRGAGDLDALAASIVELGLLNPVTITPDNRLIAGLNRLHACKKLGWTKIPVIIKDLDAIDRELAEIDENLIRNELTALEESLQIARRKEIYEIKHPETKKGGDKGNQHTGGKKRLKDTESFSQDTAKKTGKNKRTVSRKAEVGTKLKKKAAKIKGTVIEDSQKDLLVLAKMD